MAFFPLGNKIIVEPVKAQDEVINGIIVAANKLGDAVLKGTVLAVGPDATVKTGSTVAFGRYGFDEIKDGMKTYYVMPEDLVLTVVT